MNSYVRPKVEAYVSNLTRSLDDLGVTGGLEPAALGRRADDGAGGFREPDLRHPLRPVRRGVAGALHAARRAGYDTSFTFDMGGTSTWMLRRSTASRRIERQVAARRTAGAARRGDPD